MTEGGLAPGAHVVMPARRSTVSGQFVSQCTNYRCQQRFYGQTKEEAYGAGKAHVEQSEQLEFPQEGSQ